MNQNPVEEGQKFPLTIRRMGINGEGIGYFKKAVVFVPGAITGEEVVVEAVKVRDRFTEAKLNKIRKKYSKPSYRTLPSLRGVWWLPVATCGL